MTHPVSVVSNMLLYVVTTIIHYSVPLVWLEVTWVDRVNMPSAYVSVHDRKKKSKKNNRKKFKLILGQLLHLLYSLFLSFSSYLCLFLSLSLCVSVSWYTFKMSPLLICLSLSHCNSLSIFYLYLSIQIAVFKCPYFLLSLTLKLFVSLFFSISLWVFYFSLYNYISILKRSIS